MNKNIVIQNHAPKIGVGIPCHIEDLFLLETYCLPNIMKLNPAPSAIVVNINDGKEDMRKVRTELYDYLFQEHQCDVILNLAADMMVFKDTLKHVKTDIITSYGPIYKDRPVSTIIAILLRLVMCALGKRPWRGTYSIPKKVWFEEVRDSEIFNGVVDSTVKIAVNDRFESVPFPKVMIIREHQEALNKVVLHHPFNRDKPILTKIFYLAQRTPF